MARDCRFVAGLSPALPDDEVLRVILHTGKADPNASWRHSPCSIWTTFLTFSATRRPYEKSDSLPGVRKESRLIRIIRLLVASGADLDVDIPSIPTCQTRFSGVNYDLIRPNQHELTSRGGQSLDEWISRRQISPAGKRVLEAIVEEEKHKQASSSARDQFFSTC